MIITLKNNKKIELDWNFLVLQYLEEYEGGLQQLKKDINKKKNLLKIQGLFIYATVRANIDEVLTYHEAVRLVDIKDINKINDFFEKNLKEQDNFKKKPKKFTHQKKKKKK